MNHFERFLIVAVLIALGVGGYFLYQSPQVRELFTAPTPRPARQSTPAATQPRRAEPSPVSSPAKSPKISAPTRAPVKKETKPAPSPKPEPEPPRQAVQEHPEENHQVGRVLLQILAAKHLALGVSLSVADDWLEVVGETSSEENRKAILEVLDRGRGGRRIIADQLIVKAP